MSKKLSILNAIILASVVLNLCGCSKHDDRDLDCSLFTANSLLGARLISTQEIQDPEKLQASEKSQASLTDEQIIVGQTGGDIPSRRLAPATHSNFGAPNQILEYISENYRNNDLQYISEWRSLLDDFLDKVETGKAPFQN